MAGVYGTTPTTKRMSSAASYPEAGDLYLSRQLQVNRVSKEFVFNGVGRKPAAVVGDPGLLVRWDEVEYLTFQEF